MILYYDFTVMVYGTARMLYTDLVPNLQ